MASVAQASDYGCLLTLDPGLRGLGVGIFLHGKLTATDAICADEGEDANQQRAIGTAAAAWFREFRPGRWAAEDTALVFERMVLRRGRLDAVGSIIELSTVSGVVLGLVSAAGVISVEPAAWTGGRSKETVNHVRIRTRLDEAETAVLETALRSCIPRHRIEVLDAVGIGLYALGRL